ncbi:CLUMA_CG001739, isoform A [Clunio marinus]|uniref:CLUMA_CG001739, isoform A n=1 Tax=Clunio marinus TaxID=568069 RepID=A0A1J1HP02_9DIPT|nr:CLUMA_CG001739, isoform A [Clunio marinus]
MSIMLLAVLFGIRSKIRNGSYTNLYPLTGIHLKSTQVKHVNSDLIVVIGLQKQNLPKTL